MLDLHYIVEQPITFASLTAGVLLGEMLPVKIPRRGNDEMLTLSTAFSMALLLAGGLGPALIAQGIGSVIQDVASGNGTAVVATGTITMANTNVSQDACKGAPLTLHLTSN